MDEVISAVSHRDYILVITRMGKMYRIYHDEHTGAQYKIVYMGEIRLNP